MVLQRKLVLRSDCVQIKDESDWLGSFGFTYALHRFVVMETWMNQPFHHGDPYFTAKLSFVVKF